MPSIKLNVTKLRAYTRAPFYTDYLRDAPSDDTFYVRQNGEWMPLDTTLLEGSLDEFKSLVVKLQKLLDAVDIRFVPSTNQLVFIDGYGSETFITLPSARVDHNTLQLDDNNLIYVVDTPDNKTLKVTDTVYKPLDSEGTTNYKASGKLRVEGVYADVSDTILTGQEILNRLVKSEKDIIDLEKYTQGASGFLEPHNFQTDLKNEYFNQLNPQTGTTYRDSTLSQEAYNQLFNGVPANIPDQTKIKNMYDGRVWVYVDSSNMWLDDGIDTIVNANNNGVLGAVTGVAYNSENPSTKFKISIEEDSDGVSTGVMSVNGLEDEFNKVVYISQTDEEATIDSYVKRTAEGTIRTQDSVDDTDAINRREFFNWLNGTIITKDEIFNIVNELYIPEIKLENNSL